MDGINMKITSMTMIQALRSAMDVMLERDDNVVVYGQDVGYFGGVFRCTEGLQKKYGTSRVFDSPISEGSRGLSVESREIFLRQPILLELEAPF